MCMAVEWEVNVRDGTGVCNQATVVCIGASPGRKCA